MKESRRSFLKRLARTGIGVAAFETITHVNVLASHEGEIHPAYGEPHIYPKPLYDIPNVKATMTPEGNLVSMARSLNSTKEVTIYTTEFTRDSFTSDQAERVRTYTVTDDQQPFALYPIDKGKLIHREGDIWTYLYKGNQSKWETKPFNTSNENIKDIRHIGNSIVVMTDDSIFTVDPENLDNQEVLFQQEGCIPSFITTLPDIKTILTLVDQAFKSWRLVDSDWQANPDTNIDFTSIIPQDILYTYFTIGEHEIPALCYVQRQDDTIIQKSVPFVWDETSKTWKPQNTLTLSNPTLNERVLGLGTLPNGNLGLTTQYYRRRPEHTAEYQYLLREFDPTRQEVSVKGLTRRMSMSGDIRPPASVHQREGEFPTVSGMINREWWYEDMAIIAPRRTNETFLPLVEK